MCNKTKYENRGWFKCLIVIGSFAFTFVSFSVNAQSKDTVRFIHITDPHICVLPTLHQVIQDKRAHYGNGIGNLKSFLGKTSTQSSVDFIAITGDLIDFFQGGDKEGNLLENQIDEIIPILAESKIPVYLTLGNHDIATYSIGENQKLHSNQSNAGMARANWIQRTEYFKDGTYYSKIVRVGNANYRLIFLDNAYYTKKSNAGEDVFYFDEVQLDWLKSEINQSPDDKEIILMHMPFDVEKKVSNSDDGLFDLLMKNNSVKLILSGHKHINDITVFRSDGGNEITQTLTGAFGRDISNWRLIELTESAIIVSGSGTEDLEIKITD